jgi:8-oxo-dGTP pyrophosphatase MutT (NUDIX family)
MQAGIKQTRQVAALPVRRNKQGSLEVLLVTSRETRRWVIPKGWPWPDCDDHIAAAEEAREEAGVTGRIGSKPVGTYTYLKRLEKGSVRVRVTVYLLDVKNVRSKWPEKKERDRQWYSPAKAASLVAERTLKSIIRAIGEGETES